MTDTPLPMKCTKGFEFPYPASIQPIVYIPFFAFAVWSLWRVYSRTEFNILFNIDSRNSGLANVVLVFYIFTYIPFLTILLMHLVRRYFSLLVIDEDPVFFYYNFKDLGGIKRGVEFFLEQEYYLPY